MRLLPLILPVVFVLLMLTVVRADEIADALTAATEAHKKGDLAATTAAVKKVSSLLQAQAVAGLGAALPDSIGAWRGGKIETQSLEGAGGGHSLRRNYRQGDKDKGTERRATVILTVDSAVLGKVGSLLTKPEISALLGAKPLAIGPHKAVYMEKQGTLQFIVEERFLLAVEGKKLKQEEVLEVARGLKTELLK
jgi:hypothetical protein